MDQKSGERLAIFDLGTNTFNLLVRDADGSLLRSEKLPVKLGAGGLRSDEISPDAEERAIAAMHQHKAWAQEAGASRGYAFATSAMRSTRNGAEVAARIERETGIPVNIIDGDQEAAFIAGGVAQAWPERSEPRLIMDIGGGSTEFILLDGNDVLYAESFPLGVTRLVERFQPSDPMTAEDVAQINAHTEALLAPLWTWLQHVPATCLIGSSGSFDTIYNVLEGAHGRPMLELGDYRAEFSLDELPALLDRLIASSKVERLLMPGMLEMRADTLQVSALQIQLILDRLTPKTMLLSGYALKEGVWSSLQEPQCPWRASSL
jgi:exopolyphosphatase/guanosine-5'-triphosphate,3'-diphosphate pyrophosphatase